MKIAYKNKHLNFNLFFGLIWLLYCSILFTTNETIRWTYFGWLFISIIYLSTYFYQRKYKYLTIEKGTITENWPFGKKLTLAEIKTIRYFAGDYILKTETKELTINTQLIDTQELVKLTSELDKINAERS